MTTAFIIIALVITIGILYLCYASSTKSPVSAQWNQLPTAAEYKKMHPLEITDEGQPRCCYCHSDALLDVGLARYTDFRRTLLCKKCKRQLWREEI